MKLKLPFLTTFIFFYSFLGAQSDGLLWKISGNGLTKASYLFGTIHAYCDKDKIVTEEFLSAFKSVDVVAMELNLNDFSTFVYLMKTSMKVSDKPISSFLTDKQKILVDSVCRLILADSLRNLDNQTPMTLLGKMYLSESIIGCSPVPLDFIIAELAKRNNKLTYGLETPQFQDSLLSSIPDSIQINWLLEFVKDIKKAKFDFKEMLDAYNSQQSKLIYESSFKTSPELQYLREKLLDNRNKNWVNYLQKNMNSSPCFLAVGAAHLAGDLGLVELLKNAGYTLEPITIKINK